jgi:hypothetical protein
VPPDAAVAAHWLLLVVLDSCSLAAHLLSKTPAAAPLLPQDPALTVEQVHLQVNTNTYVKYTQVKCTFSTATCMLHLSELYAHRHTLHLQQRRPHLS